MNAESFSQALGDVNIKYVHEATEYRVQKQKSTTARWFAIAACFAIVIFSLIPMLMQNNGTNDPLPPGGGQLPPPDQRPIAAYIQNDVTSVEVTHIQSGKEISWTVTGKDLDQLRDWTNNLRNEIISFASDNTPDKAPGSEIFVVTISEGPYPGYSYIIDENDNHYLLIEGYWYTVTNPSCPPVTVPVA